MSVATHECTSTLLGHFDEWMQWSSTHYSKSKSDCHSSTRFAARVSAWKYGAVEVSKTVFLEDNAASYVRGPTEIREDPRDHFELLSILRGEAELEQSGRHSTLFSGDCVIYDQAKPFSLRFRGECESIFMNVPSARLLRRWPSADQLTALRVGKESKFGCFISAVLCDLINLDIDASTVCGAELGYSVTDTVLASLDLELRGRLAPQSWGDEKLLAQTKGFILAHLCDPDLRIEEIAKAQAISRSTLNRLFVAEATTPMKWIWCQRLAACHEALSSGRVRQVTAVAFDHGFNDLSHFSRSFKKMYGCSPRSLLRS